MLPRYSSYKRSRTPFSRRIPAHWTEQRLAAVLEPRCVPGGPGEELLSVFLDRGVVSYRDTDGTQVHKPSEDLSRYQLVEPGDLVLNNQQAWRGSVGVSDRRGIVSPAYLVFRPKQSLDPAFLGYMVRDRDVVAQFVLASKGVGSIQRSLYMPYLKKVILALPPRREQEEITRYLDRRTAGLNHYIGQVERKLRLLDEQREVVVNRAVTAGVTPPKALRDSGADWLPRIPADWRMIKLGHAFTERSQKGFPHEPLLTASKHHGVIANEDYGVRTTVATKGFGTLKLVERGDFVISLRSFQSGIEYAHQRGIISPAYTVLTPQTFFSHRYLRYLLKSHSMIQLLQLCVSGIREGQSVRYDKLKEMYIPLAPLEEQERIADHLDQACGDLDVLRDQCARTLELLGEYRTRLISDLVTGKAAITTL